MANRQKREQAAAELRQVQDGAQTAKGQLKGNPAIVEAITRLEERVRVIEKFLNLDVGDNK